MSNAVHLLRPTIAVRVEPTNCLCSRTCNTPFCTTKTSGHFSTRYCPAPCPVTRSCAVIRMYMNTVVFFRLAPCPPYKGDPITNPKTANYSTAKYDVYVQTAPAFWVVLLLMAHEVILYLAQSTTCKVPVCTRYDARADTSTMQQRCCCTVSPSSMVWLGHTRTTCRSTTLQCTWWYTGTYRHQLPSAPSKLVSVPCAGRQQHYVGLQTAILVVVPPGFMGMAVSPIALMSAILYTTASAAS